MKYVGDVTQIAGAKRLEIVEGNGKGVQVIEVKTGTGFKFTVVPDRGMDIAAASYKGVPISFMSKTGITSPFSFEEAGFGFFRGFYAGLLTTCGFTYMGPPCEDEGKKLGLHGRASSLIAENVSIIQGWQGDDYVIEIQGETKQAVFFGENITLKRKIRTSLGSNTLQVYDVIENQGFNPEPFMLLYHCNFGYPVLSETAHIEAEFLSSEPRDEEAKKGIDSFNYFEKPIHGYKEQVFFHKVQPDQENMAKVAIKNDQLDFAVFLKYQTTNLPLLTQWKQMGEADYALGLEPSSTYPFGRDELRRTGQLEYIQPFEKKEFILEIGIE
jgi:hypothetical protein